MAGGPGLEPGFSDPKSDVLPTGRSPKPGRHPTGLPFIRQAVCKSDSLVDPAIDDPVPVALNINE